MILSILTARAGRLMLCPGCNGNPVKGQITDDCVVVVIDVVVDDPVATTLFFVELQEAIKIAAEQNKIRNFILELLFTFLS